MTSSKVIYISGQRGPFSFLLDRGFVISRTLDVYLCGRDSPPPFYRLGKRWTTKNFDRPRSRNKITTNRNRRPSLLKREREWVALRERDNFDKFRTAFSLFVQIYYFDDKITTLERESKSLTFATEKRKREENEGKITRVKREWKPVAKVNEKRESGWL